MRIGINCGHTKSGVGSGATGFLIESDETRAVGYALMEILKGQGHTVIDCTDDKAASVAANLKKICALANAQPLDVFLSIHFNAGGGSGCEVYTYGSGDIGGAGKMKSALYSLGFKDRGIKDGSNLYVIKNTKAPSVLLEVCFVDNKEDAELYKRVGARVIALKIAEAITGEKIEESEGGLSVTQYEELKNEIKELTETVKLLATELYNYTHPMVYNYVDGNMPDWARPTIAKLVESGALKGDENGLNLTDELLRILVIADRAGVFPG